MIREGNMVKYDDYCFSSRVPAPKLLDSIEAGINKVATKNGVPVELYRDKIIGGGMLSKKTDECICIANPNYKNTYLKFCVRVTESNGSSFIYTYHFGHSKSSKMDDLMDRNRAKHPIEGIMSRGVMKIVKGSNRKQEEEREWYSTVLGVIAEAVS